MPREIGVVWSSALVCGARLCQQWSGACLSYTLKVVDSTLLLGLFDKCLDTPAGNCGIPQALICGWSRSADRAVLITCAGIVGVSPYPNVFKCLLDLFPNGRKQQGILFISGDSYKLALLLRWKERAVLRGPQSLHGRLCVPAS